MNVLCSVGAGAGYRATLHQMAMLILAFPQDLDLLLVSGHEGEEGQ